MNMKSYIPTGSVFPKTDEKLLSLTKAADCVWTGAAFCVETPLKPRKWSFCFVSDSIYEKILQEFSKKLLRIFVRENVRANNEKENFVMCEKS